MASVLAMAYLNATAQDMQGKLPALRKTFEDKYKDNITGNVYDPRDLERLEDDDVYACNFLRTLACNGDVVKAVDAIHETLVFRKEMGVWDLKETSISPEVLDKNAIYYKGEDNDGHPILYMRVKDISEGDKMEWNKLLAYRMELHHRNHPGKMCVVFFDMQNAGARSSHAELFKFSIKCCATYYPAFLAYNLVYELKGSLNAFWHVLKTFISTEQRKKIVMVTKRDIRKYINDDNLWPHMK